MNVLKSKRISLRPRTPAVISSILLCTLLAPAQITEDSPGVQAAKNLTVMIAGSFGQGAGIVFAIDDGYAYIATMFHVVRKRAEGGNDDLRADHLKVRFYQRRRNPVDAEHWEDASFSNDLAVIRARVTGLSFDLNRLGNPQTAKKGDFVYAIGQPADDLWGVTYQPGSISDVGSVWIKLQSAYVENGHSGGPLIDQQGRILGLIKQTGGSTPQALRIDRALDVLRLDLKLPVQLEIGDALTVSPKPGEARTNPKDGLTYRWIPPGTFRMGCSEQPRDPDCDKSDEFPVHDVTITKGFWLGETEVTQEAWQRVTREPNESAFPGALRPADNVTWTGAKAYCAAAGGLRLPTEAEWEYAARAGAHSANYGDLSNIAWYSENSNGQTHEVGLKAANAWNLKDMLGNVREWTGDFYDPAYYSKSPASDPANKVSSNRVSSDRVVLRGGSWYSDRGGVRVSYRNGDLTFFTDDFTGFRCAGQLP